MILIGSRAAAMQTEFYRPVKDWDIVATQREINLWHRANKDEIIDFRLSDKFENPMTKIAYKHKRLGWIEFENADLIISARLLLEAVQDEIDMMQDYESPFLTMNNCVHVGNSKPIRVASLATLFEIKDSHIYEPVRWYKNIEDWHFLKKFEELLVKGDLFDFHAKRRWETKRRTPKLNQSNKDFFGQSDKFVTQKHPHDAVHCAVACEPFVPSFTKMKSDHTKAWCDKDMFFNDMTESERLACVLEEAWVIAVERKLTVDESWTPEAAFDWALMRICTTLCSGFFREYAVKHWDILTHGRNAKYWERYNRNIDHVMETGMWEKYYAE